jgi:3-oxoacyl-[acyl-carrier protein] reductase
VKSIFISGTSRGIGQALCEHYLNQGWQVGGCSRAESSISHGNYTHYEIDVTNEKEVVFALRDFSKKTDGIEAMICNAGRGAMGPLAVSSVEEMHSVFEVNVSGTFLFLREGAKLMAQSGGSIVTLSSIAVPLDLPGESLYSASKATVEQFTRTAAREFAPLGIRVNAVGPCLMDTDLTKGLQEDIRQKLLSEQWISRTASFHEVVSVIDFFISESSSMVTGQVLYMGGV